MEKSPILAILRTSENQALVRQCLRYWSNLGGTDDPDDVMETSLTIDYDKQWLNSVSAIGPSCLFKLVQIQRREFG